MPVSEPAIKKFLVKVYLNGRRPFLSIPAITHWLWAPQIAAGPSHGSITALAYAYKSFSFFGKSLRCAHASGIVIILAIGKDLLDLTSNSIVASNAAESEASWSIIGLRSIIASVKFSWFSLGSWAAIQFLLPFKVLISPLCAITLKGCAKDHVGKVLVEYRWW